MGINLYWPKCKQSKTQKIDPFNYSHILLCYIIGWAYRYDKREKRSQWSSGIKNFQRKILYIYYLFIFIWGMDGVFRFLDLASSLYAMYPGHETKLSSMWQNQRTHCSILFKQLTLDANSINLIKPTKRYKQHNTTKQNLMHGFIILSWGHRHNKSDYLSLITTSIIWTQIRSDQIRN